MHAPSHINKLERMVSSVVTPECVSPEFDPALIARYDVAAARYISYPAAPQFRADFDEAALRAAIRASNEEPIPRPLSLHVHVPFCMSPCFCCDCDRIITCDQNHADRYLERLYREIELIAPLFDRDRPLRQLHLGSGMPNFLDIAQMRELMESLARRFSFSHEQVREYAIEIDPRFADAAYVAGLGELGFNRIAVGIQDFEPQVQQAVNRIQSVEHIREVIDAARAADFSSVSVDLICGLPRQTLDGFTRTLEQIVALGPDRVAVHGYAYLPESFKAQRQIDAAELPDAATRWALFGRALERLSAAGYVYIGMDRFARGDDELARAQRNRTLQHNFRGYSTHGDCDIIGLGVSAVGGIGDSYSENACDLAGYYAALDGGRLPVMRGLRLDEDDLIRRELIGELICHRGVDKAAFGARHRLLFDEYFLRERQRLRPLITDGLLLEDGAVLRVTSRGWLLLRIIAMCFDAYLDDAAPASCSSRLI